MATQLVPTQAVPVTPSVGQLAHMPPHIVSHGMALEEDAITDELDDTTDDDGALEEPGAATDEDGAGPLDEDAGAEEVGAADDEEPPMLAAALLDTPSELLDTPDALELGGSVEEDVTVAALLDGAALDDVSVPLEAPDDELLEASSTRTQRLEKQESPWKQVPLAKQGPPSVPSGLASPPSAGAGPVQARGRHNARSRNGWRRMVGLGSTAGREHGGSTRQSHATEFTPPAARSALNHAHPVGTGPA